jgi:gamma-glutamyltranspeptidase/glutathione hydrolase
MGETMTNQPPRLDTREIENRNRNRSTVVCQKGLVCASQPLAAMAGIDILKAGGNCIDAAICVNAMLGLMEPAMNGIGGDLFAILWSEKEQRLIGLNASGRAPFSWNLERAIESGLSFIPPQSPLAWTVPGYVGGWAALNERFGQLSLAECLAPAIEYAESGFPLSPIISASFNEARAAHESLAAVYCPDGRAPAFGEVFRNPALARCYRTIGEHGKAAFYEGEIAERIVAKSEELGGYMSMRDLAAHRDDWVEPVSTSYRSYDVWELPPNGQGIAALQMLNLLEHFDLAALGPNTAEHLHLVVEAKKLAFEDRARFYADPEFADVPVDWLVSKQYADERVKLIDPSRASRRTRAGKQRLDSDTVYLTVADGAGNMISLIQSIYMSFGSGICPDDVGFAMQNRGISFSLSPNHPNKIEPHKRPFHTIIPAFVTLEGRPLLSFGVMGGDFQPQGHVQVLANMIDFGMSPQQAGDFARVSHDGGSSPWGSSSPDGGRITCEPGISRRVKRRLADLGHDVEEGQAVFGGYQGIWRAEQPLRYFGGSDPRKDGCAIGY